MRKRKDWEVLALRVSMDRVRLDVGLVFHEPINNVYCLPDPTRDEVREKQNILVAHVVIGNPSKPPITNMFLGQQIFFGQVVTSFHQRQPVSLCRSLEEEDSN